MLSCLSVALILLLCYPIGPQAEGNVDHYLFYWFASGHFGGSGNLTFTDEFGTTDLSGAILYHSLFATPVSVDGGPVIEQRRYLNAWGASFDPQPNRIAMVSDRFGSHQWVIGDGAWVLAPARREDDTGPLPAKNHYTCYWVLEGPTISTIVQVEDQFGVAQVQVLWAVLLCNPAEKMHNGQVFPVVDPAG